MDFKIYFFIQIFLVTFIKCGSLHQRQNELHGNLEVQNTLGASTLFDTSKNNITLNIDNSVNANFARNFNKSRNDRKNPKLGSFPKRKRKIIRKKINGDVVINNTLNSGSNFKTTKMLNSKIRAVGINQEFELPIKTRREILPQKRKAPDGTKSKTNPGDQFLDYYDYLYDNFEINDDFLTELDNAYQEVILGKRDSGGLKDDNVTESAKTTTERVETTTPIPQVQTDSIAMSKISKSTTTIETPSTTEKIEIITKTFRHSKALEIPSATPWPFRYTTSASEALQNRGSRKIVQNEETKNDHLEKILKNNTKTVITRGSASFSRTGLVTHVEVQTSVKGLDVNRKNSANLKLENKLNQNKIALNNSGILSSNNTNNITNANNFQSQIGVAPLGVQPFGSAPEGTAPFGIAPEGLWPFGISKFNGTIANLSAGSNLTNVLLEANGKNGTKHKGYHLEVNNHDGTTVGDYVVVDPDTGDHNGVRYGAAEGIDPQLVRKLIFDFLQLGANSDNGS